MRDAQYWASVVHELCAMPHEAGWVEFKHNNAEPQEIGEYISALANACALEGKAHGLLQKTFERLPREGAGALAGARCHAV